MCAIAGLINCGDAALLRRMMAVMGHRGPDSRGHQWWPDCGSGLGHCRLAILDLSPRGHQPMSTAEQRDYITFNGEVYNFQEIRRELTAEGYTFATGTDTEVILRAYERWGEACVTRFNGMFAFAIFDARRGRLFAARDHLGLKPFYYWHRGGQFAFASEIKALLQCPFIERAPDYDGLLTLPAFNWRPSPDSATSGSCPRRTP